MVEDEHPEGTFFHEYTNEELCVQLGEGQLFLTYYSGLGKPRAKRVVTLATTKPEEITELLRHYKKVDSGAGK